MRNPFIEAKPVAKKLKVLFYGPSGSGKTLAALSFPKPAVIDSEGGTDLYAGRVQPFSVMRVKTLVDLEEAIKFIQADKGKTFGTLVIDPITVFYDVQKSAMSANNTKDLGYREWAKINNRMKSLYNSLTDLPVHVVVNAREAIEYEGEGSNLKKVGTKADADKGLPYVFDFIIHMNPDHSGVVIKSRGVEVSPHITTIPAVNWSVFEPISQMFLEGETIHHESDDEAANREADDMRNKDVAIAFVAYWRSQSVTDGDLLKALGVDKFSQWTHGRVAADKAVADYIQAQTQPSLPATGTDGK